MYHRLKLVLISLTTCWVSAFIVGCPFRSPLDDLSPVEVVDTALLIPPEVGDESAFIPAGSFILDDGGSAVGFFLTVSADSIRQVRLRITDRDTQRQHELTRFSLSTATFDEDVFTAGRLGTAITDHLTSGGGAFFVIDSIDVATGAGQHVTGHRIGVVLPDDLLPPFALLDVFASTADDGTALMGDRIELVQDFFYLAAIGDSLMWGNGLPWKDKIHVQLARLIEAETHRKVIDQIHAISGMMIVASEDDDVCPFDCYGEIPKTTTSIPFQVGLIERPELQDLILVNGCGNDVGAAAAPNNGGAIGEALPGFIETYCEHRMRDLLGLVHTTAPQAQVVVIGYYLAYSEQSDLPTSTAILEALKLPPADIKIGMLDEAAYLAGLVEEETREHLSAAVEAFNAETPDALPALFAAPAFAPANAVLAPDTWLYGLTNEGYILVDIDLNVSLKFFPEDPLFNFRQSACLDEDVITNPIGCMYASLGHPNPTGARVYAEEILRLLRESGFLPATE